MSSILVWPIIIPFATAVAILLVKSKGKSAQNIVLSSAALHAFFCGMVFFRVHQNGIFASQIGNWPAPFGITLVADHLSAIMLAITAVINLAVVVYSRVLRGGRIFAGQAKT